MSLIPDGFSVKHSIPYPWVNCLKTVTLTATHTHIAHIWQKPPVFNRPLSSGGSQRVCFGESRLYLQHAPVFLMKRALMEKNYCNHTCTTATMLMTKWINLRFSEVHRHGLSLSLTAAVIFKTNLTCYWECFYSKERSFIFCSLSLTTKLPQRHAKIAKHLSA